MPAPMYVKNERISLQLHPELDEKWVQGLIAEDTSILGLGDVILRDKERPQPKAGRLDLLLQDAETRQRYEVEIQLGKTDESHIIRTIEYYDIERKRYPQYDHCAVIVAEDITSRFLNVISLFNGFIPLIAIQMNAIKIGDQVTLVFTTVLGRLDLGLVDEDEGVQVPATRTDWEQWTSKQIIEIADEVLGLVRQFDSEYELHYTRSYISFAKNGKAHNFAWFEPRKKSLNLGLRIKQLQEIDGKLEEANLETLPYAYGAYRIRLTMPEVKKNAELLVQLLKLASGVDSS
jgi:hypothetical protein